MKRFNDWLARRITAVVGTMWCFYLFNGIAALSAKPAFKSHSLVTIIGWISSNWLQLILLPAIMVGQSVHTKEVKKIHDHLGIGT